MGHRHGITSSEPERGGGAWADRPRRAPGAPAAAAAGERELAFRPWGRDGRRRRPKRRRASIGLAVAAGAAPPRRAPAPLQDANPYGKRQGHLPFFGKWWSPPLFPLPGLPLGHLFPLSLSLSRSVALLSPFHIYWFAVRTPEPAWTKQTGHAPRLRGSAGFVSLAVAVLLHVGTRRSPGPAAGASRRTGAAPGSHARAPRGPVLPLG